MLQGNPIMMQFQQGRWSESHQVSNKVLMRSKLAKVKKDIAKNIKNANCKSKFYTAQLAMDAALDHRIPASQPKLSFEAETQSLSPLDFSRLFFTVFADHAEHCLHVASHLIMPSLAFIMQPIASLKFNVASLSKILLNKMEPGDPNTYSNFQQGGVYSGFVALDGKNRVLPLMPNDPQTLGQKICGVWIYGFETVHCPYVWSACARFIFCSNFKDAKGCKVPFYSKPGEQPHFLVVIIDKNHRTQFFSMKLKLQGTDQDGTSQNWTIFSNMQSIDREPNLYFKTYLINNIFREMKAETIKSYLASLKTKDEEINESRIKVLQNSPIKKSQTHRQTQQQFSSRGRQGLSQTGTFVCVQSSLQIEDSKYEDEPQPMQLNLVPHQMKHIAQNHPCQKSVNRSRNSLSQNRLQQQQLMEVKQEPNESQTEDEDMVQIRESKNELIIENEFHATPRSILIFIHQQNRIKELEEQLASLQIHVKSLNEVIQHQQRQLNEQKNSSYLHYSGSTTAYQSRTPHSREDSNNTRPITQLNQNFLQTGTFRTPVTGEQLLGAFNANNYQAQAFDQLIYQQPVKEVSPAVNNFFRLSQEIINLEAPQLISQPTGNFARISPKDTQEEEKDFQNKLALGQLETRERFDFFKPQLNRNQERDDSEISDNSSVFEQSGIPIPETKSIGDKRSRNKGKGPSIHPQIRHLQENNTHEEGEVSKIQDFNEIAQSQTLSEVSNSQLQGGDSTNSRLKRSQSSALSTMAQEIKAIKSDLKQQYDEQIVSHRRPKGSRNVLNNNVVVPPGVNQNIVALNKKLPRIPSSSSSSDDSSMDSYSGDEESKHGGRGDIDHTYNPYSFKKIEKSIFKKPAQPQVQPQLQNVLNVQNKPEKSAVIAQESKIFIEAHKESQHQQQYRYGGKTDWTMELPRISFEASRVSDEDESDDENCAGTSDSEDEKVKESIIRVEDIQLQQHRPKPNLAQKPAPESEESSDDNDQISEVERKYLMNIK